MRTAGNGIGNSPFDEPQRHWLPRPDGTLQLVEMLTGTKRCLPRR